MEKLSSFERVVGDISETDKEQILQDKGERFKDQVFEELKGKRENRGRIADHRFCKSGNE